MECTSCSPDSDFMFCGSAVRLRQPILKGPQLQNVASLGFESRNKQEETGGIEEPYVKLCSVIIIMFYLD